MDIYQKGVLTITAASFSIFAFLSLASPEKAVNWIKWYYLLEEKDKKRYNPQITLVKIRKMSLLVGFIGTLGLILSIFVNRLLILPSFIFMLLIFAISIKYTGPGSSKIKS